MGVVDTVAIVLLVEGLIAAVLCARYKVHVRYTPRHSWLDEPEPETRDQQETRRIMREHARSRRGR